MATVTIRRLDPAVVEALKARARAHGRSLEAELRLILARVAFPPSPEQMAALADQLAAAPDVPPGDRRR